MLFLKNKCLNAQVWRIEDEIKISVEDDIINSSEIFIFIFSFHIDFKSPRSQKISNDLDVWGHTGKGKKEKHCIFLKQKFDSI